MCRSVETASCISYYLKTVKGDGLLGRKSPPQKPCKVNNCLKQTMGLAVGCRGRECMGDMKHMFYGNCRNV